MTMNTGNSRALSEELMLKIRLIKERILKRRSKAERDRVNKKLKRATDKTGIEFELVEEGRKK